MTTADVIVLIIIIGFVLLVIVVRRSSSSSLDKKVEGKHKKDVEQKGRENP
jgi:hypothetical protein